MKITIKKSHILDVLSKIQGLTGRKSNLAITANVCIKTMATGVTLVATDLETGIEGTYPAHVEAEGAIAINARTLFEIVREFPVDDIQINEVENYWIEIGNKTVQYHIVGMNPDDFPDIPQITDIPFFDVEASSFKSMIEKTVVVTGTPEDQRAHIIGILFEHIQSDTNKASVIRMVATDGSRLSKVDYLCTADIELPSAQRILIPKKGLIEVNRFLDTTGIVRIGFKENHFIVKKEAETIMIRLLEGEFPEYADIIAKENGHDIKIENQLFTMMLKRMSILATDNYKAVIFNFDQDRLTITSTNPDMGESKEDMAIEYTGKSIEVAFNPRFFIDGLSSIDDETIILNIVDEEKPCILDGETAKDFVSVIMPMKL